MKKKRNQYAPEEKVAILRRHLLEKEPLSKLFDEVENSSGAKTAANSSAAGRVKNEEDQCPSTRSIG
jgi:hypothetical protein